MANELLTPKLVAGATYYAVIYNEAGTVWNGSAFEAFTDANYATYPVTMAQLGTASGRYSATRPAALSASTFYSYEVFRQPGGSPSLSADLLEAQGTLGPQVADTYARLGAPAGASVSADIAAAKVDTAAIKVQTDKLTFTVTNQVDSNVLDWKSATAPAMTGDAFARLGAPAGASVSADVAAAKSDTAAIKTATNTGVAPGAAGGLFIAGTNAATTVTTALTTTFTGNVTGSVASVTGAVGSVTAAVTLPTIPTNWITAAGIAADAIGASELAADAVTEIQSGLATAASIAALNNLSASDVLTQAAAALTTTVADSVPSDGTRPSVAQSAYAVYQFLTERSVSGTTMTVTKPDGTTVLMTFTLDSATAPTAITRAT